MSDLAMPVRATAGLGTVNAGEGCMVLSSIKGWTGSDRPPPLVFCHGATGRVLDGTALGLGQYELVNELAKFFTVIVTDLGGDAWANSLHISRIADAITHLSSVWGSTGPVTLVGASMGNAGCWAFMKAAASFGVTVRAQVGIIPVCDIEDMRANNRGGLTASINAAYGGFYNNSTEGASHNPVIIAQGLSSSIPTKLFYSNADTTTVPATVMALKANRPSTIIQDVGSGGHGQASIVAATDDAVQFARFAA